MITKRQKKQCTRSPPSPLSGKWASAWTGHPSTAACQRHCKEVSQPFPPHDFKCNVQHIPSGSLASGGLGGGLGLLSLLRALARLALLLALTDSLCAGGRAGLRALGAALLDHIEGGTDDGTLGLHLTATAGLGLLLSRVLAYNGRQVASPVACAGPTHLRDTLPPLSTAENGPCDATWVLALKEERLGFAVLETEDLAVCADEELALQSYCQHPYHIHIDCPCNIVRDL